MSKPMYLTFPNLILKDGLTDIKKCMSDAMSYCLFYQFILYQNSPNPKESASNYLGITFPDIEKSLKRGAYLHESIYKKAPKTSISKEMIFDFYKNKKTEFEVVCFLAFASLKSMIQRQVYKKITNDYLLSRMSGNSKKNGEINPKLKKYAGRYQLDKIKIELQLNWGLKYYAEMTRGFYVSFKMPLSSLALIAEKNKKAYKLKLLKRQKQEATKNAIEQLSKKSNFEFKNQDK
jgi:hypothetical protein